jgi:hypothetical protein
MSRWTAALCAALVVAAVAFASAAAGSTARRSITIGVGDSIVLKRTHVYCLVGSTAGTTAIGCVYEEHGAPVSGTYWIGIAATGETTLGRVKNGKATVVAKRRPSVAGRTNKIYTVGTDTDFYLRGTNLWCGTAGDSLGPYIFCEPTSHRAGIYGIGMGDKDALLACYNGRKWVDVKYVKHFA